MSERSPTEPTPPSSEIVTDPTAAIGAVATQATTPTEDPAVGDGAPTTVEEAETIWKRRVAGKDRAHAAAEQALREERDRIARERDELLRRQTEQTREGMSEADQWKQRYEEAERRAAEAEQKRVLDLRSVKYAAAAEHLDEAALVAMDEGKLAALNSRLTGEPEVGAGPIDPNMAPRRSAAPPTPIGEKTVEDLKADLLKHEPEFIAGLNLPPTNTG